MKLFGLLLTTILVVISSSYVIHVILKNKELRNTNNILIINLLITDIICSVIVCSLVVPLMVTHLAGVEIYPNCDTLALVVEWLIMSTQMMVLPPAVHRLICVARPFTHKLIMTKRRIIMMIVVLWVTTIVPFITLWRDDRKVYIPSLGTCATADNGIELGTLLVLLGYISSLVLTITSAVYLRHKMINLKAYIRELHRCGMDRGKLNNSQRLKELLKEQVKPTISVFVVGGVDAVFNFLMISISLLLRMFSTPIMQFQIIQTAPCFFFSY